MEVTEKEERILRKMKRQDAKPWTLIRTTEARDRVLGEFNSSILDPVAPLGGEQDMKVLSEMNSLVDYHEEFVKSLAARVDS